VSKRSLGVMRVLSKAFHMKNENGSSFVDPIRKPWVSVGLLVLFFMLLPIWPIEGNWWGIPAWSLLALLASLLTSIFTAFVILRVWQDPDESMEEETDD
jgi:hypothetical protein